MPQAITRIREAQGAGPHQWTIRVFEGDALEGLEPVQVFERAVDARPGVLRFKHDVGVKKKEPRSTNGKPPFDTELQEALLLPEVVATFDVQVAFTPNAWNPRKLLFRTDHSDACSLQSGPEALIGLLARPRAKRIEVGAHCGQHGLTRPKCWPGPGVCQQKSACLVKMYSRAARCSSSVIECQREPERCR